MSEEEEYQPTVDDFLKGRYCQYCGVKNEGDIPSHPWLCPTDEAAGQLDQPRAMVEAYKRTHMMTQRRPGKPRIASAAGYKPKRSRWVGGATRALLGQESAKKKRDNRSKNKAAKKSRRRNRS